MDKIIVFVVPLFAISVLLIFSYGTPKEEKKLLLYTKNGEGYVHKNILYSTQVIKKIAEENGYVVDTSNDAVVMTEENLRKYCVLIFSNTNNETFDTDKQRLDFQRYIQAGGRFVSIHSACGSEREWPWFWKNLGGKFFRHPPLQTFDIKVIDADNPSTVHLSDVWSWEDECYYLKHLNPDIHVLTAADLRTIEDVEKDIYPGAAFGNYFPLSWCHEFDGGRQWHTSLGHSAEYYDNIDFQNHILGGMKWVTQPKFKLDYSKATKVLLID